MTNLDYIRQLPGMEKYINKGNCAGEVGSIIGLDMIGWCDRACKKCENTEATINGKPAPYIFACPVTPGQKVYFARYYCGTTEDEVMSVTFYKEDGEIKWEALNDVDECFGNGTGNPTKWNEEVFATREEAEKAFKEMLTDDK